MRSGTIKLILFFTLVLVAIVTCIDPIYPDQLVLQQLGTLVIMLPLLLDLKRNRISLFAFTCFALFVLIHLVGARWIYSCVPYEDWLHHVFGIDLHTGADVSRNQYDRFVHLSFGILLFPYLLESIEKRISRIALSVLFAWSLLQAISLFYESFEWMLTTIVSSEASTNYNGQQGDPWDAQKDMTLAMLGSSAMALIYLIKGKLSGIGRKAARE